MDRLTLNIDGVEEGTINWKFTKDISSTLDLLPESAKQRYLAILSDSLRMFVRFLNATTESVIKLDYGADNFELIAYALSAISQKSINDIENMSK